MTSRPGPAIHESLQHRGGGPPRPQARRQPSKPLVHTQNAPPQDSVDPNNDAQRRASEDAAGKTRGVGNAKGKPRLPDAAIQTDNTEPVPAGKPQLFFCNAVNHGPDTTALQSPQIQAACAPPTLPMPPRPGSSFPGDVSMAAPQIIPGIKPRKDVSPRPGLDTPPVTFPGGSKSMATLRLSKANSRGTETADLFPWNGNHPEDTLSEALVKSGISNKPTIMNETQTARPALWPLLKKNNNKGASTLSSYLMTVLEKRQSYGRLTTPNTFKPPPRLTLRDSTREAWLHDLANPTVGLRRLSRTIPHGITGKVLLDQCLNKNIPIPRAIWLAKCVGLNEMRSHKRKGQAGTITWVRGWTSSVEQFLEGIIATIGREEWKPKITYALRLVTNLYREYLLEGEHFLDWVLNSLESSTSERLFIWLLVTSVYWKELTETRRRGRRLAESLLTHADKVIPHSNAHSPVLMKSQLSQMDDGDSGAPLRNYMDNVLANLITTSPSSLLLPKVWDKYIGLLRHVVETRPDQDITIRLDDLDRRNRRLCSPSSKPSTKAHNSSQAFVSLLDSIDYRKTIHIETLCKEGIDLIPSTENLISKALHWASSVYREGIHRVYLVTRLLRRWNRLGFDTDNGILSFLRSMGARKDIDIRNIFKIVAELVRSKTFSVGKYLQWLIATGSLNGNKDLSEASSWPVRLLTEIPLSGLPVEIRNLRSTLLQGSGFSVDAEERLFDETQESIQQHIPNLFDMASLVDNPPEIKIADLSSTIRLELSVWLRQQVAENVEMIEQATSKHSSCEEDVPVSTISPSDFYAIRSYIEDFGDISILADIVGIVSTSTDYNVLAALVDTLHYHYKSLNAIGAFKPLLHKVTSRYTALRNLRFPSREYVLSLLDLARTAKADSQLVQSLQDDLIRCDQRNAIAACSPVSDNMGEATHTGVEGDDEIDRILSSGTSMDQQIMSRVFSKITSRLELLISKGMTSPESCASWFHRLRSFEDKAFDKLVADWISSLHMNSQGKVMLAALPSLVTSGCLTLSKFAELSRRSIESRRTSNDDGIIRMCVEALNALLPSENLNRLCPSYDAYRYRLEQRKFCQESNGGVLAFIREALETCAPQAPAIDTQISGLLASNRLRSIIRYFGIVDRKSLDEALGVEASSGEALSLCMKSLLDGLLDPSGSLRKFSIPASPPCKLLIKRIGLAECSLENQVTSIVNVADELSLPFCQLELRHIFSANPAQSEAYDAASTALLESIKTAVEEDRSAWSDLVAGLDSDLNTKVSPCPFAAQPNLTHVLDPGTCGTRDHKRLCIPHLLGRGCLLRHQE